jgi:two-component system OmpR family sensor kinase
VRSASTTSETVDVGATLDASARRVAARAAERNVRIETRAAPGIIVADRDAGLERVFDNLLDNALRYAPGGSRIEIEAATRDAVARVTVSDHGPGVPPGERTRVFERFHRSPGATGPGAGLGLSIARSIVEGHGGRIDLAETPGGGATFIVDVPISSRR